MESTKDQPRPKLSARSKKTTQIQARSVKRDASVWLFGLDWRSWCFIIGFLKHCILQTAPFEKGLPCRIFCCFFIHPAAGPRGARGSRTHPGDGGKFFWGYTFHFQEFHCRHHCLIYQCSAFILQPIPLIFWRCSSTLIII